MKTIFSQSEVYRQYLSAFTKKDLQKLTKYQFYQNNRNSFNKILQKLILFQTLIYKTSKYLAYDTQILAALYLHLGTVVNMKTGEGKTLASVLALLLHSSKQNGLHMLTTSDYLAQRDRN